jgi:hypothetical protein
MYAEGRGVGPDPVAACTLTKMARTAAQMSVPAATIEAYQAWLNEAERFENEFCGPLTSEAAMTAARSRGCYGFGMPEAVLSVGEHTVNVGRSGIALAGTPADKLTGLTNSGTPGARLRVCAARGAIPGGVEGGRDLLGNRALDRRRRAR